MTMTQPSPTARCQVGTVATIVRGPAHNLGMLVVVIQGMNADAQADIPRPYSTWCVESLGSRLQANGNPHWRFVVPDEFMQPLAHLDPSEVRELVVRHAKEDFDVEAARLAQLITRHYATPDEAGLVGEKRMAREELFWLMEEADTAATLREAGFWADENGGESLDFDVQCHGRDLKLCACLDLAGDWWMMGTARTSRTLSSIDFRLPPRAPRGEVFHRLGTEWRQLFGRGVALPDDWTRAEVYEALLRTRRDLLPGEPALRVDSAFFRFIVKRLEACGVARHDEVTLRHGEGQLTLATPAGTYHCPARGQWTVSVQVQFGDLLDAMPTRLPNGTFLLTWDPAGLHLNGTHLAATWLDPVE